MSTLTRQEITQLFKKARRAIRSPGLDILVYPTSRPFGYLLVVTPRAIGNAPQRNKIRRRVKAIFHEHNLAQKQFDCIIIAKKPLNDWSYAELRDFILQTFEQLHSPKT